MWNIFVLTSLLVSYGGCDEKERKLVSVVNPGCDACGGDALLVYTRADGAVDRVHTVWDTSGGKPTIIIAHTDLNNTLDIAWKERRPDSFRWKTPPPYSFAYIIDELWEFNDTNDTGDWRWEWPTVKLDTIHLNWSQIELRQSDSAVSLTLRADLQSSAQPGGYVLLELGAVSEHGEAPRLPHLVVGSNSSLLEVSLVNATRGSYQHARLALSLLLVSTDNALDSWKQSLIKSLDDEHTPGIFKMWEVISPETQRAGDGGYLQLRPVCYTAAAREVTASTVMQLSHLNTTTVSRLITARTAARYFLEPDARAVLVQSTLATFGGAGDGFYTRTNYTAWAVTVGWGRPPVERFSPLVVGVLAAGVSVPIALVLVGAVGLAVRASRRYRQNRHQRLIR